MRISDWSSDVCSSDLDPKMAIAWPATRPCGLVTECIIMKKTIAALDDLLLRHPRSVGETYGEHATIAIRFAMGMIGGGVRSEEHTSELQSLMRISYAVFCLKKKK